MHEIANTISEIGHSIYRVSMHHDPEKGFWEQVRADMAQTRRERREWLLSKFPEQGLQMDPLEIAAAIEKLIETAGPELVNRESVVATSKGTPPFQVSAYKPRTQWVNPEDPKSPPLRETFKILTLGVTSGLRPHQDPSNCYEGLVVFGTSPGLSSDLLVRTHPELHGPAMMQGIRNNFLPPTLGEQGRFVAMRALDQLGLVR